MTTYISDHLPQFIIVKNLLEKIIDRNDDQIEHRDYKNFYTDTFKRDIDEIDWSLAAGNTDVNLNFEIFLRPIGKILDKHVPLKKASRKKQKEKIKPWVTRGIRQSMKIRDKLYKQFIKSKNNEIREIKQTAFKTYRNKITDLLQTSRQSHYQKYFSDNKKNAKALSQGIHEIIYSKKAGKTNN